MRSRPTTCISGPVRCWSGRHARARRRREILELAASQGVRNVQVFGSVARGTDGPGCDIDLLADIPADMGLFALARLESDIAELVGAGVDLVPSGALRDVVAGGVAARADLSDETVADAVSLRLAFSSSDVSSPAPAPAAS